ncbi:DUF4328 domain-containing protein [Streptomyces fragilis]|uniref:DUF4328 domain-containing protein n=1 Tax=Streptomyces fragilis TaxID=67301 RepID=A0ABV2YH50_9ACTN|nr:DUF4328 domain-containing protein [Streptomyces fragilis]
MSAPGALRPPVVPRGARPASRGPLVVLTVLLAAAALSDLFAVHAGVRLLTLLGGDQGFVAVPVDELRSAHELYGTTAGRLQAAAHLLCAVAFLVWFVAMRRAAGPLAPDRFRNGPGWALAAWFVPVANLVLPHRVAVDMWRACSPTPSEERTPPRTPLWPVHLWWGLFLGAVLIGRCGAAGLDLADTLQRTRTAVALSTASDLLAVASAASAAYFAVRLTAMHRAKASR